MQPIHGAATSWSEWELSTVEDVAIDFPPLARWRQRCVVIAIQPIQPFFHSAQSATVWLFRDELHCIIMAARFRLPLVCER